VIDKIAEITHESIDQVEHVIAQKKEKCRLDTHKKVYQRSVSALKMKIADYVRECAEMDGETTEIIEEQLSEI
jgi:hypothetical protein